MESLDDRILEWQAAKRDVEAHTRYGPQQQDAVDARERSRVVDTWLEPRQQRGDVGFLVDEAGEQRHIDCLARLVPAQDGKQAVDTR